MKTSALVCSLFLATTKAAFSYELLLSGGTTGQNSVNLPEIMGGRHWDSFSINHSPGQAEQLGFLFGNHYALGSYVSVQPEPGDLPAGIIQLSLSYQIEQHLALNFTNYQATPCDFHYGYQVVIRPGAIGPALMTYNLAPENATLVFDYEIGTEIYLDFMVDPTFVHDSHASWAWHPAVIDPADPGCASLELSGAIKPVSLQVISAIPEPSSLGLSAIGFALMSFWSARRSRR